MRSIRRLLSLALSAGILLVNGLTLAQSSGTTTADLKGRIVDDKSLGLPGVTVTATNKDTGLSRSTVTKEDGSYVVPLLSPGPYQVRAEVSLYTPALFENVRLTLGSTTTVDATLRPAESTTAVVTVTAETPLIDPSKTDLSASIDRNKIDQLPNVARNFLSFSLTTPRVSEDRGPQSGAAATSGFSINGQSPRYNNLAVDGFDNNDQATGSVRATFSQDAVQEYQVITNPYASEFGRTAGGVINIITRSGTNDFRGSAFYFYRGDSLESADRLTGEKVPLKDHRFGASLGGPLIKDKTFFFAAYERQSTDTANPVTISDADVALIQSKGFAVENGNVPFSVRNDSFVLKLDHQFGASTFLTLRGNWSKGKDDDQQQWGGLVAESAGGSRDSRDTSGALGLTSVLGTSSFNELRTLYSDGSYTVSPLDQTYGVSVDLPGVATFGTQRFLPQPRDSKIFQLFDAFSFEPGGSGKVRVKIGAEYDRVHLSGSLPNFFAGLYRFSAIPAGSPGFPPAGLTVRQAFGAGVPVVFIQSFGDPTGDDSTQQLAAFIQGDVTVAKNLLLRLGLRYDYEKPIDPFPSDGNNLAPRLSFSWNMADNVRVKGGVGRFFGTSAFGPMFAVSIQNNVRVRTKIRVLGVGPSSLWPTVPWQLPDRRFPDEQSAGSVVPPFILQPGEYQSAHTDQASLGGEFTIGGKLLASVDGVYARGKNILIARDINPITRPPSGRPDPRYSDIFLYESTGNSWYTAGTLGLVSRLGGPFEFTAFYTLAKSEDDYIDWLTEFQPQDPLDPAAERGPSVQSPDQKATVTATWSTVGRSKSWRGGFTFATIVDWKNGIHDNILAGFDRNQNGDALSDRPPGVGRNSSKLPAQFSLDLRASVTIPFGDTPSFEIVGICTNVTDHKNVIQQQNIQNLPTYGDPTLYGAGRIFQLGARVSF